MVSMHGLDPLKQRIHRYEVTSVWGSLTATLKKGDITQSPYVGDRHTFEVRNMNSGRVCGGFKARYVGTVGCDGPGKCIFEGDHNTNGAPLSCPNAACAEHHGEICYTVDELDALNKDRHACCM